MIDVFGPLPELTLQRGLLQIENGAARIAPETLAFGASRPMRGRAAFFDEINSRLAQPQFATADRANVYRFAEYADWHDALARSRDLGEALVPIINKGNFGFGLKLAKTPGTEPLTAINAKAVREGKVVVYRQDSAGLNNIDWNAPIEQSLVFANNISRLARQRQQSAMLTRLRMIFLNGRSFLSLGEWVRRC